MYVIDKNNSILKIKKTKENNILHIYIFVLLVDIKFKNLSFILTKSAKIR